MSDDGRDALTVIALLGNVFSPYYASRRRRGNPDPLDHCAVNVVLYGRGARWALTERGRADLARDRQTLRIGPSQLRWDGEHLTIDIDEWCVPIPRRLKGRIRLTPRALVDYEANLDEAGAHRWRPLAPIARVEAQFDQPAVRWAGPAYLDSNAGDGPIEEAFRGWDWLRAPIGDETAVIYDVRRRSGGEHGLALRFDAQGCVHRIEAPLVAPLPGTRWAVARACRSERDGGASVLRTLEDTPFYARSLVETELLGTRTTAIHESLSLDRFRSRWVQALLPFRLPRAWRPHPGGPSVADRM
jgi:carotenoid 1,2-hydratase